MERDYDFSSALHARRSRCAGEDRPHRRRARGRAAQSAQGRDPQGAGGVRSARRRLADRPSRRRHQRQRRSRARRASSGTSWASGCSRPASASSTIRCAGAACARARSTPKASPARALRAGRGRRAQDLAPRLARPRASSACHHRPCAARRLLGAVARRRPICISSRARATPERLIADIARGLLRHRPDRHGRQSS